MFLTMCVTEGLNTASPPTMKEFGQLLAVAPNYGIDFQRPDNGPQQKTVDAVSFAPPSSST